MGQIASIFLRCLGVKVKEDGEDNRRLISHAQGPSASIYLDHVTELQQSVYQPLISTNVDAHCLHRDATAILNQGRIIDIPCFVSHRDPDIDHDDLYSSGLDNSSISCLVQETETINYVEEMKDVIMSKHELRGPAKRVVDSKAKNKTTVDFVHGSNVKGVTSKEIMLDERRLAPCASSACGRRWAVEGTSPQLVSHRDFSSVVNMVITSGGSQEEIKHVITNKDEPSKLAKRAFGSGVKSTTKVGFAIDSNMEGATVSKETGLNQKRIESSGTSSTPRSCRVVKGTSPVLVSQEVFSLAANMVTTSCSSQEEIKDVALKKHEPKGSAKQLFSTENVAKLDSINCRNLEGMAISKDMTLDEPRSGPDNAGSTPRKCCMVKGPSPPVLVSQEAFSSAANMVSTCCNLQGNISKHGSIGPYTSIQRILLVGEGDFSFSASLAIAFGSASNMVATSLNSPDFLIRNYGGFPTNLSELETRGSIVLHGVDATKMAKHPHLASLKFDRIIFNFPHSGFKQDSPECEIRRHQRLVRGFLRNAKKMIEEDGQIHVTHKSNAFFLKWDIPKLGTDQGLRLIQEVNFKRSKYPGYHTKYGFGGDKDFDCNPSKTYKFGLNS
uniref:25S rRNA (uridine-N(3))-methyltransferase BMT5-like domain-containing protein n=1 Tax=Opuntia streptacantha TaxID=393608 RepID=A0A7C9FB12_OPUST